MGCGSSSAVTTATATSAPERERGETKHEEEKPKAQKVKVGINGFGRVGRTLMRELLARGGDRLEVVAVNDPYLTAEYCAYLLQHDTVHGDLSRSLALTARSKDDRLEVSAAQGKRELSVRVLAAKTPAEIPWKECGVEWVVECSGRFCTRDAATKHVDNGGAQRVLVTSCVPGICPVVYGVNHETAIDHKEKVFSAGSCVLNCLAPVVSVLHAEFGVQKLLATSVHSVTSSQKTVDGPAGADEEHWREGRASSGNVIPSPCDDIAMIGQVVPGIEGRAAGRAFKVPTLDVSAVDMTVMLSKPAQYLDVCEALRKASQSKMKGIISVYNEDVVSSDLVGESASAVVDVKAGIAIDETFLKMIAWHDNEWGFASRLADLLLYAASL